MTNTVELTRRPLVPDRHRRPSRQGVWLVVLVALGVGLAAGAASAGPAWAEPSPAPVPAPNLPDGDSRPPETNPSPSAASSPPTGVPSPAPAPPGGADDDPGVFDIPGQIRKAINEFLLWVAKSGLKPVMEALGATALSTPDLTGNEHVTAIWMTSLVAANGIYVLFVIAGGFTVASRETLQSQYGLKQVAPRLAVGAVVSNVSLILCGKAIEAANALTAAIAGQGVDGPSAATAIVGILDQPLTSATQPNILLALLVIAVVVLGIVVVVTFLLRVALLVVLVGVAPLVLVCHATPQTEGLAYTWWRAFGACLGLQLAQAVIVLATVKVFLTPSGLMLMGVPATTSGLLGVLVCVAMLWLLVKLPGLMKQFVLAPLGLRSQGRGLVGHLLQAYVMIKTLGAAARPTARQRAGNNARTGAGTSAARPVPATGGRRGSPRTALSRPSPPGPVAFSNAPTTQAPLSAPAGTVGAPTFSHAPQPSTPAAAPTGPVPAAPFSHPNPPQPKRARPGRRPAPVVFSNVTSPPTSPTPTDPATAATFSNPPVRQSAPRRPPAPVTPVFSSTPSVPRTRPTAAQQPTAAPRPSRAGGPPVTTTPAPAPAPRPSPPPPAGGTAPVFRPASSPPPVTPPPRPSPPVRRRPPEGGEA